MRVRFWWCVWAQCPGLGPVRLAQLVDLALSLGLSLQDLWAWPLSRLQRELDWPERVLLALDRYRASAGEDPLRLCPKRFLVPADQLWPKGFSDLERRPSLLVWDGDGRLLAPLAEGRSVAVVGSRRASAQGIRAAELLGARLASAGWPVVSGLAEGVDAAAHRGCLSAGGQPVAVLGTPLERAYPPEHARLQRQVADSGLLLTELAPGAGISRATFALRNRLMVALAGDVIVVECPETSGALLSAAEAQRQGRSLWVLPADALRPSAKGSNALLCRGAQPIVDLGQWVSDLGPGPLMPPSAPVCDALTRSSTHQQVDPELMALLQHTTSLPALASQLNRRQDQLAMHLMDLELRGLVVAEPGMRWRLA